MLNSVTNFGTKICIKAIKKKEHRIIGDCQIKLQTIRRQQQNTMQIHICYNKIYEAVTS